MSRPTKRTPEVEARICSALEVGNTRAVAAALAGVHRHSLASWCRRFPGFLARIEESEARFQARAVGQIALAGGRDWRANAWLLERSDPQHWGRRDHVEVGIAPAAIDEAERLALELGIPAAEILLEAEQLARRFTGEEGSNR